MRKNRFLVIGVLLLIAAAAVFGWYSRRAKRNASHHAPGAAAAEEKRVPQAAMQRLLEAFDKAPGDALEATARQLAADPSAEVPSDDLYFYEQFLRSVPEERRANVIDLLKKKRQSKH